MLIVNYIYMGIGLTIGALIGVIVIFLAITFLACFCGFIRGMIKAFRINKAYRFGCRYIDSTVTDPETRKRLKKKMHQDISDRILGKNIDKTTRETFEDEYGFSLDDVTKAQ